jgi:hypothetical protein
MLAESLRNPEGHAIRAARTRAARGRVRFYSAFLPMVAALSTPAPAVTLQQKSPRFQRLITNDTTCRQHASPAALMQGRGMPASVSTGFFDRPSPMPAPARAVLALSALAIFCLRVSFSQNPVSTFAGHALAAPVPAGAARAPEVLTPLLFAIENPPVPFLGSDGQTHLVYELFVTNFSSGEALLERVEVLGDGKASARLAAPWRRARRRSFSCTSRCPPMRRFPKSSAIASPRASPRRHPASRR